MTAKEMTRGMGREIALMLESDPSEEERVARVRELGASLSALLDVRGVA